MATELTRTRWKFHNAWDEITYLYHKVLYWFYERGNRRNAARFCGRLESLLEAASPDHSAILGEACRALISEVQGDLRKAIEYRENEIHLIERFQRISATSQDREVILEGYDAGGLSDRFDLLAILDHDLGDLDKAIEALRKSKRIYQGSRCHFDGQDLLDDYVSERNGGAVREASSRAVRGWRKML